MNQELKKHFTKEVIHMSNKHIKICPTSLVIREIKLKTRMRYHYILSKMPKIKGRQWIPSDTATLETKKFVVS